MEHYKKVMLYWTTFMVVALCLYTAYHLRLLIAPTGLIPASLYWPLFALACLFYYLWSLRFGYMRNIKGPALSGYASSFSLFLCFLPFFEVIDIARFVHFSIPPFRRAVPSVSFNLWAHIIVMSACFVLIIYGEWRARHPVVSHYTVAFDKPLVKSTITIALLSDIHLGSLVKRRQCDKMADKINSLKPDIVLIAGDIFDHGMRIWDKDRLAECFARIKAPLGVWAVPGNHDYSSGVNSGDENPEQLKLFRRFMAEGNVHVLVDECVPVKDASGSILFYILGRDDKAAETLGKGRQSVASLTSDLNKDEAPDAPLIMLDHQPYNLAEACSAGIDLELCGHTHAGQIWPDTHFIKKRYDNAYGLKRIEAGGRVMTAITTSGYGVYGPVIRIGCKSEIALISLSL
jgi:predicted MPP superfamily phosphohydrolase